MKSYEYILNSSKVIERTRFCQETVTYKVQKDVTQKVSLQELWFLHSALHLMLVNICMKFHEDTLNGFKVTERMRFCLRNCYLQSPKGYNSKSIKTRVMVLAFCTSSNVGKYLFELSWGYLERFLIYRADTTISQNLLISISKGHNSNNTQSRVMVLALCTSSMLLYICVKFHKNISNGFGVTERTWFWTDRRTDDHGKNKMSPNPTGGDINTDS